jgi:hypothetical protein
MAYGQAVRLVTSFLSEYAEKGKQVDESYGEARFRVMPPTVGHKHRPLTRMPPKRR